MNLSEKIKDIFQTNNPKVLSSSLNEFGDLLEYGDWNKNEIIESVNCLLSQIRNISDLSVIENILHICFNIMNSHTVFSGFDLDILVSCINKLNSECISYVLTFLGFSGRKEYYTIIQSFLENDVLKKDAEEALFELDYRTNKS